MIAALRLLVLLSVVALAACDDGATEAPAAMPDAEVPPPRSMDGGRDAAAPLDASRPPADAAPPAMDAARPDAAADAAAEDARVDAGPMAATLPTMLSATGLYVEGSTEELAPGVHPYEPRYVLWSDGAEKQRYLFIPEGSQIDTDDMDEWRFPVGTKVWKEFSLDGKRLETRLFWKTGPNAWLKIAYVWNEGETDATASKQGVENVRGTTHDVPEQGACDSCHEGRPDFLLGVSAIQLAHDGSGTTLGSLAAAGLLTSPPARDFALPNDPTWNALGYLHANCGNCHNPKSLAWDRVDLDLWLRTAEVGGAASATHSHQSTVGVAVTETVGGPHALRIAAGEPAQSMLIERMKTRGSEYAMPPTASERVDDDGVAKVSGWIRGSVRTEERMARVRSELGVSARLRWTAVCCGILLAAACSDDDGATDGDAGDAANQGDGGPSTAGRSGSGAGTGGSRAGSGGRGGNGSGNAGTQSQAGRGGDSGAAGSDAAAGDAAVDAGTDGGDPPSMPTVCKAPVAATNPGNDCPDADPVPLELELVHGGMSIPVLVTHAPDDDTRLFVVERNGKIIILDPATGDPIEEFIDLGDTIITNTGSGDDERGLLGMAFHPDYPEDPRFFVAYTATGQSGLEDVVTQFEVSAADPNKADPSSGHDLIRITDFASNHNGGMLAFGPDGCLFYGTGDGGAGDDPQLNGQDLNEPLAKMLRFDVDNPTQAAPGNLPGAGVPHIWDYGLRNPWRFSFDRETGDLYIGDVGQGAWEEVDVEAKGTGHKNYGWSVTEGNHCRPGQAGCDQTDVDMMAGAVDDYPHGSGDDCVVGGFVYRGSAIPSLKGWYVYGDNGSGRKIRAFVWDGTGRCNDETLVLSERDTIATGADITGFGEDNDGELYVTTSNAVHRIVAK